MGKMRKFKFLSFCLIREELTSDSEDESFEEDKEKDDVRFDNAVERSSMSALYDDDPGVK